MIDIVATYHSTQFQGEPIIQTQQNGEKPNFESQLGPLGTNSRHKFFFSKNLASSVSRYHDQLSSCLLSEKTNDPILKRFSDGQADEVIS